MINLGVCQTPLIYKEFQEIYKEKKSRKTGKENEQLKYMSSRQNIQEV